MHHPFRFPSAVGARWTRAEDEALTRGIEKDGARNWDHIAAKYLGGRRTGEQCLHRWQKVLKPGLVKGPWTPEEDAMILDCLQRGITKWSEIADRIPGRIGKQVGGSGASAAACSRWSRRHLPNNATVALTRSSSTPQPPPPQPPPPVRSAASASTTT
jgi:hypothetical protein